MKRSTEHYSQLFTCDGCEYNNGYIGCGGHCLKNILLSSGGIKPGMKLVIAEKPSQGRAFARVLGADKTRDGYMDGNNWIVSWCYGHLLRLMQPDEMDPALHHWRQEDLPILPDPWRFVPGDGKREQLDRLKTLMNDPAVTSIVCATDAGREGELIFRLVYAYANCGKPVERLWINSMEDEAIREGFHHLRPSAEFDNLYQAALCRAEADWLIGINGTRRYSALCHRKGIRIGRVMSPTLAMLVNRQTEIKGFGPSRFYTVELSGNGIKSVSEPIADMGEADRLVSACGGSAIVKRVEHTRKEHKPPMLFNLSALQQEANRLFGYSALFTLDTAQQLYEKKLLSYPRTDSRYITEDMRDSVAAMVKPACSAQNYPADFTPDTARFADSSKVTDHFALLPTANVTRSALADLFEEERNVLSLVMRRLLEAVSGPCVFEETVVTLECGGETFTVKGKTVIDPGWCAYGEPEKGNALPTLKEGETIPVRAKRHDHKTAPPKPYNEATLLEAMENAASGDFADGVERSGLGTPATRASTIEKLVDCGYVKRMGRNLIPTERARLLVELLPEELTSPALTAQWENELLRVERGETAPADFMADIVSLTRRIVSAPVDREAIEKLSHFGEDPVGHCPRCGKPVYEMAKGFACSGDCSFVLWKDSGYLSKAGITLSRELAAELLENGEAFVENAGFHDSHEGYLVLVEMGGKYPSYKYRATDREPF